MANFNLELAKKKWAETTDEDVLQASQNIENYSPEVREVILDEADKRKSKTTLDENNIKKPKKTFCNIIGVAGLITILVLIASILTGFENWSRIIWLIVLWVLIIGTFKFEKKLSVILFAYTCLTIIYIVFSVGMLGIELLGALTLPLIICILSGMWMFELLKKINCK